MANTNRKPRTPRATPAAAAAPAAAPVAVKGPTLAALPAATVRAGTARAAAYNALAGCIGQTRAQCLEAVKQAELDWHAEKGRVVKKVAPAGWLSLFGAVFE